MVTQAIRMAAILLTLEIIGATAHLWLMGRFSWLLYEDRYRTLIARLSMLDLFVALIPGVAAGAILSVSLRKNARFTGWWVIAITIVAFLSCASRALEAAMGENVCRLVADSLGIMTYIGVPIIGPIC